MFELTVDREFCAAHAIRVAGVVEPVHGHNWRVTVCVGSASLDDDGLVCDFHALERALDEIIAPWRNADLNAAIAFASRNPTAEVVAQAIGERLDSWTRSVCREGVRTLWARVTEAPGCAAVWRREPSRA